MVNGKQQADDRNRQGIADHLFVYGVEANEKYDGQGEHKYSLIPA